MSTFTYKSVGYVIEHLRNKGRYEIDHFLEMHSVPVELFQDWPPSGSKLGLLRQVFRELIKREDRSTLKKIVEKALCELDEPNRQDLESALREDGFTLTDGILGIGTVAVVKERTVIKDLIERNQSLSKEVLLHHLEQSHDLYTEGKWDASVGQGRNFIEQLLNDIASYRAQRRGDKPDLSKPVKVRDYLLTSGFLEEDERKKLVDGVYSYLSEKGSHPGISEQRVAYISMILSLTIGQYLLEKLETLS